MAAKQLVPESLQEWLQVNVAPDFHEVSRLSSEESSVDSESEPFRSLYAARELLSAIRARVEQDAAALCSQDEYMAVLACLELNVAMNYINSEETSSGRRSLELCVEKCQSVADKKAVGFPLAVALSQLGVLAGNSGENQSALDFLLQVKEIHNVYEGGTYPPVNSEWLTGELKSKWERETAFEDVYTHTLFYLAQVYGHLDQPKLSAEHCQTTLARQLETKRYDSIEWSLNCATLSQYFINVHNFPQARHCLASASTVTQHFRTDNSESANQELKERLVQVEADIARCWLKYCLALLSLSVEASENVVPSSSDGLEATVTRFEPLEVSEVEMQVPCQLVDSMELARPLFIFGQQQVGVAKRYFTSEEFASDNAAIVQDHSNLFKHLVHFESDLSVKCRMHKRRLDMLAAVFSELNPSHFLQITRELGFQLAEIHSEMAQLKITLAENSPSAHAVDKINRLLRSGLSYYQQLLATYYEQPGNSLPNCIDPVHLRTVLVSQLSMARLHSKLIAGSQEEEVCNLRCALELYQWIVDYCDSHQQDTRECFAQEEGMCREMAQLLPMKIASVLRQ